MQCFLENQPSWGHLHKSNPLFLGLLLSMIWSWISLMQCCCSVSLALSASALVWSSIFAENGIYKHHLHIVATFFHLGTSSWTSRLAHVRNNFGTCWRQRFERMLSFLYIPECLNKFIDVLPKNLQQKVLVWFLII